MGDDKVTNCNIEYITLDEDNNNSKVINTSSLNNGRMLISNGINALERDTIQKTNMIFVTNYWLNYISNEVMATFHTTGLDLRRKNPLFYSYSQERILVKLLEHFS